ncbi:MAG: delta-lactam-biosynthetic de-N-acetylase [Clostridia bacterium]|jgi:peptidoglycan-N-acetylmuramic acid deacetylase
MKKMIRTGSNLKKNKVCGDEMAGKKKRKKNQFERNVLIAVVLLVLVAGLVTYLFNLDFPEISDDPIIGSTTKETEDTTTTSVTTVTTTVVTTETTTQKPVTTETSKVTTSEITTKETTVSVTTSETPKETSKQAEDPNFADRSILEKVGDVSNKKYSWWYYPNNENKPTQIDPGIARIIAPYNGIYIGETDEKVLYLTFDEGYEMGYTASILDTLKKHDVKAVFFITGYYLDKNQDLVDRMVNEGHIVGNHSVSHPSFPDIDNDKIYDELYNLDKKMVERYGFRTRLFRPPSGEYSERTLMITDMLGYKTVFWSFAYDDWYTDKIRGANYAYEKVMSNIHNGAVLLLHAVSKDNAEALDSIITACKEKGYTFKLLN